MGKGQTKKADAQIKADANKLVSDATFLHRAMKKIGEFGIVGEEKNKLILFLSGLTKDFDMPMSVMVKGQSSSGKSNLIRKTTLIFPPECVISRASLSAKAPVHGQGSLKGKILYLFEYRGGKDAQYLLRLQQSEKVIAHEFTTVRGATRETKIAQREGSPVIFTTTTESRVFVDDEHVFYRSGLTSLRSRASRSCKPSSLPRVKKNSRTCRCGTKRSGRSPEQTATVNSRLGLAKSLKWFRKNTSASVATGTVS
jgi:hypothetical protein